MAWDSVREDVNSYSYFLDISPFQDDDPLAFRGSYALSGDPPAYTGVYPCFTSLLAKKHLDVMVTLTGMASTDALIAFKTSLKKTHGYRK